MKISTKEMVLVALFTGLTAVGAAINIPIGEVPITMQSLFVILSGLILGPKLAALSQLVYILLGLMGIPIFAGFSGGIQSLMKASFGFLIGFIFSAYVVGKIGHFEKGVSPKRIWLASIVGTGVIYLFGLPYMYFILNIILAKGLSFMAVLNIGCLLFLPGDILKLAIASMIAIKILPILNMTDRSRKPLNAKIKKR